MKANAIQIIREFEMNLIKFPVANLLINELKITKN